MTSFTTGQNVAFPCYRDNTTGHRGVVLGVSTKFKGWYKVEHKGKVYDMAGWKLTAAK